MRWYLNETRTVATMEREDGSLFTLSNDKGVMDMLALWLQPIEAWDTDKNVNYDTLVNSLDTTGIIKVDIIEA